MRKTFRQACLKTATEYHGKLEITHVEKIANLSAKLSFDRKYDVTLSNFIYGLIN